MNNNNRFAIGAQCVLIIGDSRFMTELIAAGCDTLGVTCPGGVLPEAGVGMDLEFLEERCRIVYHMQVVVAPCRPGDGMILQRAASAAYARRRRAWRVPLESPVAVCPQGASYLLDGRVLNLGTEGALIAMDAPLRSGELLTVYIALPGETEHAIAARVMRRVETAPPQFGVWFATVSPEARQALTRFMWAQLRALYPGDIAALWPGGRKKKIPQQAWRELMRQAGMNREEP